MADAHDIAAQALNWRRIRAAMHEVDRQERGGDPSMLPDDVLVDMLVGVIAAHAKKEGSTGRIKARLAAVNAS